MKGTKVISAMSRSAGGGCMTRNVVLPDLLVDAGCAGVAVGGTASPHREPMCCTPGELGPCAPSPPIVGRGVSGSTDDWCADVGRGGSSLCRSPRCGGACCGSWYRSDRALRRPVTSMAWVLSLGELVASPCCPPASARQAINDPAGSAFSSVWSSACGKYCSPAVAIVREWNQFAVCGAPARLQ